jgi:NADPH:quinone reductase-like Zn-dependent oxidoreductase
MERLPLQLTCARCNVRCIATCSPRNFDLVKDYGAEIVLDYNSPTCAADIRRYTKNGLKYCLDTIGTAGTLTQCYAAIGRGGGRYTALERIDPDFAGQLRKTVRADWVMGLSMSGERIELPGGYLCEARPDRRAFGAQWFATMQKLLDATSAPRRFPRHP